MFGVIEFHTGILITDTFLSEKPLSRPFLCPSGFPMKFTALASVTGRFLGSGSPMYFPVENPHQAHSCVRFTQTVQLQEMYTSLYCSTDR